MEKLTISLSSCLFISCAPGEGDLELPRVCVQGCHRCSCSESFTRGESCHWLVGSWCSSVLVSAMLRCGLGEQGLLTPLVCQWRTTEVFILLSLIEQTAASWNCMVLWQVRSSIDPVWIQFCYHRSVNEWSYPQKKLKAYHSNKYLTRWFKQQRLPR